MYQDKVGNGSRAARKIGGAGPGTKKGTKLCSNLTTKVHTPPKRFSSAPNAYDGHLGGAMNVVLMPIGGGHLLLCNFSLCRYIESRSHMAVQIEISTGSIAL